ncbi:olfactory receptor 2D2-like [Rhinatrema bivittatum]|uniref:olfactory receptor 2D2-like n=1 Tax=Rhinatrema bivittatum TaxID=194408 RepID=UPI00112B0EC8|nr:olfactory receptor 2D2-like [Rhinatrema bivittatum]
MESGNQTLVLEFILLGLSEKPELELVLFAVFLPVYLITLGANVLIIAVFCVDQHLHTPMYFFLCNLSVLDICYSSAYIPKSLKDFLSEKKTISFNGCAAQMYIALSLGVAECLFLAVMACDRYVAICHPLNYTVIMSWAVCMKTAAGTWIGGFLLSVVYVAFTLPLPFCGHNQINHFTCEVTAVLRLACTDIRKSEIAIFVMAVLVLIVPLSLIFLTYLHIIVAILRIRSADGRRRAFSTCTSHLTVVTLFFGTAMVMYLNPRSVVPAEKDKIFSLFYGAIIPMLNPLIYTLRNKEVKGALRKAIRGRQMSSAICCKW